MNEIFKKKSKKSLSYEEWCIKKDTEKKLKGKLVKEMKRELHHELARTLEDAIHRKRKGDALVSTWISNKKREFLKSRSKVRKEDEYKRNFEIMKNRTNEQAFTEWLKNSLKNMKKEKIQK